MTDPAPPTGQQLDELETLAKNIPSGPWTVDDSRAELRGSHGNLLADLWDDRLGAYFAAMHDAALPLVAEVRRLRAELATAQADTLAEVATELEGIDFHPNAKSSSSDLCRLLAGRFRRKALRVLDDVRSSAAEDTLPAWLYSRFIERLDATAWDLLTDDDRTYWEHQARAVRRAVARGGFKTTERAAAPAAGVTGEGTA